MDNKKEQEIPFGAFDSELMHQEINIPEGFEATIEGNKIILTRTESNDDEIRKELLEIFKENKGPIYISLTPQKKSFLISLLEKQGEPKSAGKMQVSEKLYEHIRNTCACIDDALCSDTLSDLTDYLEMASKDILSALDMIEKQDEQKSKF